MDKSGDGSTAAEVNEEFRFGCMCGEADDVCVLLNQQACECVCGRGATKLPIEARRGVEGRVLLMILVQRGRRRGNSRSVGRRRRRIVGVRGIRGDRCPGVVCVRGTVWARRQIRVRRMDLCMMVVVVVKVVQRQVVHGCAGVDAWCNLRRDRSGRPGWREHGGQRRVPSDASWWGRG